MSHLLYKRLPQRIALKGRSTCVKPVAYIVEGKSSSVPAPKNLEFKNQLEALKSMSVVVADSGEIDLVKKYHPQDCTTNPRCISAEEQNDVRITRRAR